MAGAVGLGEVVLPKRENAAWHRIRRGFDVGHNTVMPDLPIGSLAARSYWVEFAGTEEDRGRILEAIKTAKPPSEETLVSRSRSDTEMGS